MLFENATRESSRDDVYRLRGIIIARGCQEKGRKEDSDESRSRLGHAILLSRCYFTTARLKRGNIVEPGWFLWHRKENPWGSMGIIILSNEEPRLLRKTFLLSISRDLRRAFSPFRSFTRNRSRGVNASVSSIIFYSPFQRNSVVFIREGKGSVIISSGERRLCKVFAHARGNRQRVAFTKLVILVLVPGTGQIVIDAAHIAAVCANCRGVIGSVADSR